MDFDSKWGGSIPPGPVIKLRKGKKYMGKTTGWRKIADNEIGAIMTKEEKDKYRKKLFKWGLALQKMPTNKPKFNKTKKIDTEMVSE